MNKKSLEKVESIGTAPIIYVIAASTALLLALNLLLIYNVSSYLATANNNTSILQWLGMSAIASIMGMSIPNIKYMDSQENTSKIESVIIMVMGGLIISIQGFIIYNLITTNLDSQAQVLAIFNVALGIAVDVILGLLATKKVKEIMGVVDNTSTKSTNTASTSNNNTVNSSSSTTKSSVPVKVKKKDKEKK